MGLEVTTFMSNSESLNIELPFKMGEALFPFLFRLRPSLYALIFIRASLGLSLVELRASAAEAAP